MSSHMNECVVIDDCDLNDDKPGPSRMIHKPKACQIEASWFEQEYQTPARQVKDSHISSEDISKYQNFIWNQPYDRMVPGYGLTPRELANIPSDGRKGWLVSSHFFWLSRCLNKQSHVRCFVFDRHLRPEAVDKLFPLSCRGQIRTIILIMCVGRQDDGIVFFGSNKAQGDHWSLCVIDVRDGTVYYCDTLGWPAPPDIFSGIINYTKVTGLVHRKQLQLKMAHCASVDQHTCNQECTNYPLQTCSDVCGVVVMICTAVAALDQSLFQMLMTPLDKTLNMYLTDPTEFSTYLRYVLISWLANDDVDITKISLKPDFDPRKIEENSQIGPCPRSLSKRLPMKRKTGPESKTESSGISLKNAKVLKTMDVISTYILDAKQSGVTSSQLLEEVSQLTKKGGGKNIIEEFPIRQLCQQLSFNNNVERCQDHVASMKEYVQEFLQRTDNPVILMKTAGGGKVMDKTDFYIALQTPFQKKLMETYGRQCICVEMSKKSEKSGLSFNLITISVFFDGLYEIPVAYMISNSQEERVIQRFFQAVQRNVGEIQTDVFIGDIKSDMYQVWTEYFPKPLKHMCHIWEVCQILHQGMHRFMTDQSIISHCKDYLRIIPYIFEEEAFHAYIHAFLVILKQHSQEFHDYFRDKFLDHKANFWASCFRVIPQAKYVPFLKPFQGVLQAIGFFDNGSLNRFDVMFHKLLQLTIFLERSMIQLSSETKQTLAIRNIQRNHQLSPGNLDFYRSTSGDEWCISASDDNNHITLMDSSIEDCDCVFKCENCCICVHRYICSCTEFLLNTGACKHIHVLHSIKKVNGVINTEANSPEGKRNKKCLNNGSADDVDVLKSSVRKELVRLSNRVFNCSDGKKMKSLLVDLKNLV